MILCGGARSVQIIKKPHAECLYFEEFVGRSDECTCGTRGTTTDQKLKRKTFCSMLHTFISVEISRGLFRNDFMRRRAERTDKYVSTEMLKSNRKNPLLTPTEGSYAFYMLSLREEIKGLHGCKRVAALQKDR